MASILTGPVCIVDGSWGIYVPQQWAERYGLSAVKSANVSPFDVDRLLRGPDDANYWESWDSVLSDYCHTVAGVRHYLTQDSDLFEYPETYQWEQ